MNKKLYFTGVGLMFILGACTRYMTEETFLEAPQQDTITLQNLKTRELVTCRNNGTETAENCAKMFEMSGFVRLSDIPSQTAEYDIKKPTTYPTRSWREGEKNPRW